MESVLEEIPLGTDENVGEEAAEVLSKLNDVESLHLE